MRRTLSFARYICVTLLIAGCATAPRPRETCPADPSRPFPVRIVEMNGSGGELGAAHAAALGGPIRSLFLAYFGQYFHSQFERTLSLVAAAAFGPYIAPQHREEIRALASGLGFDEREVLLGQCFLDLSPMTACSTITLPADAAPDHVARFGRNLDFPSFDVADKETVVLIFRPTGRYAFASVAWPGMIGVLSGMNEHGLTLANMEVDRGRRLPSAMPYTLLYRTILERCRTVDEAIDLLRSTPRQTANNLMLMDAAGDRAVAEITPDAVTVRRATDSQALISTNHQRGEDVDEPGRCERYDCLHDAASNSVGRLGVSEIEHLLGEVAQGDMTLQSMVFEPSTRTLYLATGANAPTRSYHRLDLTQYFASPELAQR
jgi:predicted choloylglycine hydrolase